jgi:hypothetical protein
MDIEFGDNGVEDFKPQILGDFLCGLRAITSAENRVQLFVSEITELGGGQLKFSG